MSNPPKYYFQDIPADLMKEIMDEMEALKSEPSLADVEEADDWLNRHNVPSTIPGWYDSVGARALFESAKKLRTLSGRIPTEWGSRSFDFRR